MWRMLARLGKYGQTRAFSILHFTHIDRMLSSVDLINLYMSVCLTAGVFFFLVFTGPETFLGWLTKALNDLTSGGHEDRPKVHLNMDTYGAETLSSYPGLDTHTYTHTHTHTHTHTLGTGLRETHFPEDDTETRFCSWETL